MYSLPNEDPDLHLSDQDRVDWLSDALADHYGDAVMDVPAGISFCDHHADPGRQGRRRDGPGLRPRLLRGDRLVAA